MKMALFQQDNVFLKEILTIIISLLEKDNLQMIKVCTLDNLRMVKRMEKDNLNTQKSQDIKVNI